jgi:hypothetical protein
MLCCYLLVNESIQVENDSLQVDNQNFGCFHYSCSFGYIYFFLAEVT